MNDLTFAFRQLRKNPGFAAVAVLTLALGIGANTALFSVINALMMRSLPVPEPQELVQLSVNGSQGRNHTFSFPGYERLRETSQTLQQLFAAGQVGQDRMIASGQGGTETEMIRSQPVTGNFFSILGVKPFLGRLLTSADDQPKNAERVVVINHGFWQRRFGSNPAVVGQTLTLSEFPLTIVGVTPPGFFGIQPGENPDLWLPLQLTGAIRPQSLSEGYDWLCLFGRVGSRPALRTALAELTTTYQRYREENAASLNADESARRRQERLELRPASSGWSRLREQFRQPLLLLSAVAALVLLAVCANVASLMLARAVSRQREFSIRAALGAKRGRLLRQLVAESALLAALGGLMGLLVAQWGARLLVAFAELQPDPLSFNLAPDGRVLGFTMGISLVACMAFGLIPALRSSRVDLAAALGGAGTAALANPSRQRAQHALVVLQVAVSLVLLVGAGLFVRTLQNLKGTDMGFARENVVLFQTTFGQRIESKRRLATYRELLRKLQETPGVTAASLSRIIPLTENTWGQQLEIEGYTPRADEVLRVSGMSVAGRYFETMGTPLLHGRDFGLQDDRPETASAANAPGVAIINESMARKYFGNESALGRRLRFSRRNGRPLEIIGVVRDAKYGSLREPAPPTFYVYSFNEIRSWDMAFVARSRQPATVINQLRNTVRETDPSLQIVRSVITMDEVVNRSLRRERMVASLGGFFSLTALALACLGIYGTISFMVAQRTREMGVRLALGAQSRHLLVLVIGSGLRLVVTGSMIGLAGALMVARLMARLLYGVSPFDPVTFLGMTLLLVVVALLASWLPARRAARVDPMVALRGE